MNNYLVFASILYTNSSRMSKLASSSYTKTILNNKPANNTIPETSRYTMTNRQKSRLEAVLDVYKLRGLSWSIKYFLKSIVSLLFSPFWSFYYKLDFDPHTLEKNSFIFPSLEYKKFNYFHHPYNTTWSNERRIEIPLIKHFMTNSEPNKTLELGNVMSHYIDSTHDIVDEYESDSRIKNIDIMKFKPKKKYDLIFSISTLEHIGVDGEKDPSKALKTLQHLKTLLSKNGKLIFTIPIGYNKMLDEAIKKDKYLLTNIYYLKRVTGDNRWVEVDKTGAFMSSYGFPYRWGNTIILGLFTNSINN